MFFFCSRITFSIHYFWSSWLLRLLLAVIVSQTFPILMTLTVLWRIGQVFCRISLHLSLLMLFSWLYDGYKFFERAPQRRNAILMANPTKGMCSQYNASLDHLAEVMFPSLSIAVTLCFSPLFQSVFFGNESLSGAHTQGTGLPW